MEERCEDLPETCDEMMLLPQVPDFRTPHRGLTKVHQIRTASGALLKKAKKKGPKGWTLCTNATKRHVNPPGGIMPHQVFFPGCGVLLFSINRQGVMTFACNNDFGNAYTQEPFSQSL